MDYSKLPPRVADLFQRLSIPVAFDGDVGEAPQGAKGSPLGSFHRDTGIIHFPPPGPLDASVALHELGHWTAGTFDQRRWRDFGLDAVVDSLRLLPPHESIKVIIDLMPSGSWADYAAEEVIAQTCCDELVKLLGLEPSPRDKIYLEGYLRGAPRSFLEHLVPALRRVGRTMGNLVVQTAYRSEAA